MDTQFSQNGMREPAGSLSGELARRSIPGSVAQTATNEALERDVEFILVDCFVAVGQAVGTRKTLTYEAVSWWREHYRARFLGAMRRFGNRWLQDRDRVSAVIFMLGERATRYAGDEAVIDLQSAQRAAEDVERYCSLHARRAARASRPGTLDGPGATDNQLPLIAGYWCTEEDEGG